MATTAAPVDQCDVCNCTDKLNDPHVTQLVMWCSTFSLMGLLGAFYIIVATGSVAWQLRMAAPQKLGEYLHNSAVLIVLLAFGTGLGGGVRFLGSMNTAFWGSFWAYETDRVNECFVSAYLLQFSLWLEMGASVFMAVTYYQLSGQGTGISARACWTYVACTIASSVLMAIVPAYVGDNDNTSGIIVQGAYENLTVWCWIEQPIHQYSMYYGWCLVAMVIMLALLGVACYRDAHTRRRLTVKITVAHQRIRCRMLTLIVVWMVVRVTGLLQSLDSLYLGGEGQHSLLLLHASIGSMMGAVDAVVYSVTSSGMRHFFTSLQFRIEQSRLLSSRLKSADPRHHRHRGGGGGLRRPQRPLPARPQMRTIGALGTNLVGRKKKPAHRAVTGSLAGGGRRDGDAVGDDGRPNDTLSLDDSQSVGDSDSGSVVSGGDGAGGTVYLQRNGSGTSMGDSSTDRDSHGRTRSRSRSHSHSGGGGGGNGDDDDDTDGRETPSQDFAGSLGPGGGAGGMMQATTHSLLPIDDSMRGSTAHSLPRPGLAMPMGMAGALAPGGGGGDGDSLGTAMGMGMGMGMRMGMGMGMEMGMGMGSPGGVAAASSSPLLADGRFPARLVVAAGAVHMGSLLAAGSHGEVFRGVHRNRPVAIVRKYPHHRHDAHGDDLLGNVAREVAILAVAGPHPYVAHFAGVWGVAAAGRRLRACVLLEFCDGDVWKALVLSRRHSASGLAADGDGVDVVARGGVALKLKLKWLSQLAQALHHLHSLAPAAAVHHNLKPQKMLITAGDRDVRLSGFGRARTWGPAGGGGGSGSSGDSEADSGPDHSDSSGAEGADGASSPAAAAGTAARGARWTRPADSLHTNLTNLPFMPPEAAALLRRCRQRRREQQWPGRDGGAGGRRGRAGTGGGSDARGRGGDGAGGPVGDFDAAVAAEVDRDGGLAWDVYAYGVMCSCVLAEQLPFEAMLATDHGIDLRDLNEDLLARAAARAAAAENDDSDGGDGGDALEGALYDAATDDDNDTDGSVSPGGGGGDGGQRAKAAAAARAEETLLAGVVDRGLRPHVPDTLPRFVAAFVRRMWDADPAQRPTMAEVVAFWADGTERALDEVAVMQEETVAAAASAASAAAVSSPTTGSETGLL